MRLTEKVLREYNEYRIDSLYDYENHQPERDDEALDRVIAYAKAHPDNHDQDIWYDTPDSWERDDEPTRREMMDGDEPACGTTMCVAGFQAIAIDGLSPRAMNRNAVSFSKWAGFRLGLNAWEREALFMNARNYNIEEVAEDIKNNVYR